MFFLCPISVGFYCVFRNFLRFSREFKFRAFFFFGREIWNLIQRKVHEKKLWEIFKKFQNFQISRAFFLKREIWNFIQRRVHEEKLLFHDFKKFQNLKFRALFFLKREISNFYQRKANDSKKKKKLLFRDFENFKISNFARFFLRGAKFQFWIFKRREKKEEIGYVTRQSHCDLVTDSFLLFGLN